MESARSLALGGKVIHAEDHILAICNGTNLMLRCSFCGEPVFYKAGFERKKHFSHFKDLPLRQLEECALRQKTAAGSILSSSGYSTKGQSLELFQAKIIEVFSSRNSEFEDLVLIVDEEVKELSQRFCKVYRNRYSDVFDISRKQCRKIFEHEILSRVMHRESILLEVISYLQNVSAVGMLEKLFSYVIQKLINSQEDDMYSNVQSSALMLSIDTHEVLTSLCTMLASCLWLEAFIDIENRREIDKSLGLNLSRRDDGNEEEEIEVDAFPKTGGAKPVKGRDVEASIELTSDEFLQGCEKTVVIERMANCSLCKGFTSTARKAWEEHPKRCSRCNGKLRLLVVESYSIWIDAEGSYRQNIFYTEERYEQNILYRFGVCRRHRKIRILGLGHEGINGGGHGDLVLNIYADVDYGKPEVKFPWHSS